MIQLTAFYPGGEGKSFNMDYYVKKHIHMLDSLSGGALKVVTVDKGVQGLGSEAPRYLAIGHFYFENIAAFQNSLALHFKEIMADIPNYTNIQPVFQFSEVVK